MADNKGQYTIPLGLDIKPMQDGLQETLVTLDKAESKAKDTGKAVTEAFDKGAAAADKAEKKANDFGSKLDGVSEIAKKAGKDIESSLNLDKTTKDFANKVAELRKKLDEVATNKKIGIEIDSKTVDEIEGIKNTLAQNFQNISDALKRGGEELYDNINKTKKDIEEITANMDRVRNDPAYNVPGADSQELRREWRAHAEDLAASNEVLEQYQAQLTEVDTAEKNLTQTLADANKAVEANRKANEELAKGQNESSSASDRLNRQLTEMKNRLYEMAIAGKSGTEEFKTLQNEAIKLRQQIASVDSTINTFAKRTAILDVTIQAVQGLVGAFAAAQGAMALFGEENEDVAQALLKVNAAMAVLQGLQTVGKTLNKDSALWTLLYRNNTISLTAALQGQTVATQAGIIATRAMGVALKALGIGLVVAALAFLIENWDKVKAAMDKVLPAGLSMGKMFDRLKSIVMGVGNTVVQFLIKPFSALAALMRGDAAGFQQAIKEMFDFKGNFMNAYNDQELKNQREHQKKMELEEIGRLERDLQRRKNRGENVMKEEIALQARRLKVYRAGEKDYKENLERLEDLQDAHYKYNKDEAEKAAKEAKRLADKAAKEALKLRKDQNDQIIKFTKALRASQVQEMEEGAAKQRAQALAEYEQQKEDLEREVALTKEASEKKAQILESIEKSYQTRIRKIDQDEATKRLESQAKADEMIARFQQDSVEKGLELLRLDHEERLREIEKNYKDEEETRLKLIAALEESTARETQTIRNNWAQQELRRQEMAEILAVEMASEYSIKNQRSEQAKQIALMKIRLEYADKALQELRKNGAKETDEAVLQAKYTIAAIQNELNFEENEYAKRPFNMLEFLGINVSEEDEQRIKDAGAKMMDNIREISDFIVSQYDRRINKHQEMIDKYEKDIDKLDKQLEKEKKLRDDGAANNVDAIEREIAEKKALQDEELKQQEELVRKKQAVQRAQMAVDTAVQLVNLTTASTDIFKSLAGIPFIGVPLAIGLISTMFGAFAASKIRAAQAINDQGNKKFRKGGWIGGASHEAGGTKFIAQDGSGIELEKDEMVIRAKRARKYPTISEKLNDETFPTSGLNEAELFSFLAELGISTAADEATRDEVNSIRAGGKRTGATSEKDYGAQMAEDLRYLAQSKRKEVQTWSDDIWHYKKKGSKLIKVRRK